MVAKKNRLNIRSRVWILDSDGQTVFGLGRLRILETVRRVGSLHAAAKELDISYRAVWGKIKSSEESLGFPLLKRSIGGASGGGSVLTDEAEMLAADFQEIFRATEAYANDLFAVKMKEFKAARKAKAKAAVEQQEKT